MGRDSDESCLICIWRRENPMPFYVTHFCGNVPIEVYKLGGNLQNYPPSLSDVFRNTSSYTLNNPV